jgi:hypothetical protein
MTDEAVGLIGGLCSSIESFAAHPDQADLRVRRFGKQAA